MGFLFSGMHCTMLIEAMNVHAIKGKHIYCIFANFENQSS